MTLRRTLALVRELRRADEATPIVLMGYYNPIYRYGAGELSRRMPSPPGSTGSSSSICRPRRMPS